MGIPDHSPVLVFRDSLLRISGRLCRHFGLGTFTSIASLILAEFQLRPYPHLGDLAKLGSAAVLENFGYRQLHNLWRVWGWWQYLTAQHAWGEMPRVGFVAGK